MFKIHLFNKCKAVDLHLYRDLIKDNVSAERMTEGIQVQYKRFNDPEFASKEFIEKFSRYNN